MPEDTDVEATQLSRDTPTVPADRPGARKIRLHSTTDLDRRTVAAREARELALTIEKDMGGDLTAVQAALVDRFVSLCAWAVSQDVAAANGEAFDVAQYAAVANTLKRLAETLGLRRTAKPVEDLQSYLARTERSS